MLGVLPSGGTSEQQNGSGENPLIFLKEQDEGLQLRTEKCNCFLSFQPETKTKTKTSDNGNSNKPVCMSNLEIHSPKFFLQLILFQISGKCETW